MSEGGKYAQGLFTGAAIGGLIGAGLAFFLSPRSGKENQQMVVDKYYDVKDRFVKMTDDVTETVMDIFGEVSEATVCLYDDAVDLFTKQVNAFNQNVDEIDKDKYLDMIDNIGDALTKNKRNNPKHIDKIKKYWARNWRNVQDLFN